MKLAAFLLAVLIGMGLLIGSCKKSRRVKVESEVTSGQVHNTSPRSNTPQPHVENPRIYTSGELTLTKDWSKPVAIPLADFDGEETFHMDPFQQAVNLEVRVNGFDIVKLTATSDGKGWVCDKALKGAFYEIRISPGESINAFKAYIKLKGS